MKIGFVIDDTIDKPDGVQQYVLALGTWLSDNGHEVHYLTANSERADIPNIHSLSRNIRVRFNGNHLTIPAYSSKNQIKKVLDEVGFDVLHVQTPHSPFFAQRIVNAASPSTAIIGTFHILPHSKLVAYGSSLLRFLLKPSLSRMRPILAVSFAAKEFADESFKIRTKVVPNTIDLKPFFDAKPFFAYKHSPTIVYLNRLEERKGCRYLLEAVNKLVSDGDAPEGLHVLICGKGPELSSLQEFVSLNNLEKIISFEGFVPEKDKARYIASADIAVYPSTGGESFGIVLLEGMAASRGVVLAGNNPGYASVMGEFQNQLFDPRDIPELTDLLRTHLTHPRARKTISLLQKKRAQMFDVSVVGPKIVRVYKDALRDLQ